MYKVARRGVSPCHVLPLRSVGVPLVVQMPHAVLVEHAVGVVHPSVDGGVVVGGAEVLAVGGVEGVAEFHLLPAYKLADGTLLPTVAVELDVEQRGALQFQRYEIVYTVDSQFHVQPLCHVVLAVYYGNGRNVFRLLHGQQQILLSLFHFQHGMLVAQHRRLYLGHGGSCHQHRHQCEYDFLHVFIL